MKKLFALFFIVASMQIYAQKAQWITINKKDIDTNIWINFRKKITIKEKTNNPVFAQIACDTKYWLYINGKLVVFEGGLKRGPNRTDTYSDFVDLSPHLIKGENTIAILVWYFGKSGFSHISSGKPGLFFDAKNANLYSDSTWKYCINTAYYTTKGKSEPNFRLAEHNVAFDAQKEIANWTTPTFDDSKWQKTKNAGFSPSKIWGNLVARPIPMFADFGLKEFLNIDYKAINNRKNDTITLDLPYNAQITPYLKIEAAAGNKIDIFTDDYYVANNLEFKSVRAEYITKKGIQSYESFGWMNGHQVKYVIPKSIKVLELKYRETGFDTKLAGSFTCNDEFLNKLWQKSQRTLYVNMRDNYFDCPDRERAQWWGDVVLELGEAFYALDPKSTLLAKKGFDEFFNWQKPSGELYAPIPGNWTNELPQQSLAVISPYGLGTYFKYSGDYELYIKHYPAIKKYLNLWSVDTLGIVSNRPGGWPWADWGKNIDIILLEQIWYYFAIKEASKMALANSNKEDAKVYEKNAAKIKSNFEKNFWKNNQYRSKNYTDSTDERGQALAVLAGLADTANHKNEILSILTQKYNASPYIEKYVLEALFKLNKPKEAIERIKNRYKPMVESKLSTLWELWDLNNDGTYNHGWSGGPLTLMNQYLAGIEPTDIGFLTYKISPRLDILPEINVKMTSPKGDIEMNALRADSAITIQTKVPNSMCNIIINTSLLAKKEIYIDGKLLMKNENKLPDFEDTYYGNKNQPKKYTYVQLVKSDYIISLGVGEYKIVMK